VGVGVARDALSSRTLPTEQPARTADVTRDGRNHRRRCRGVCRPSRV